MSFKTASAILRSRWFVDQQWAEQHLPIVVSIIKGQPLAGQLFDKKAFDDEEAGSGGGEQERKIYCAVTVKEGGVVSSNYYSDFNNAPEGSIAVIGIAGPIMKYGDWCSYGSQDYMEMIKKADKAANISGIILKIDSPGGQVDGTSTLADTIKNSSTPIYAFVDDGMMASAAMWIGSAATKIYASQKTDYIGSIGVFCTLYDFKSYLEKEGLPVHEIYAPQSSEKNKDYKDALKGDYKGVQTDLKFLADQFIATIKTNRGETASANADQWMHGKMFYAEDAIKVGLIDGIKSFEEVVKEISNHKTGTNDQPATQGNLKNQNTMFGNKYPKLHALKGKEASSITASEIDAVNEELTANGVTGIGMISAADVTAAENAIAEIGTLKTASEKITGELATANDTIATMKTAAATSATKITELEAEVKRLGKQPGATPSAAVVTEEKEETEPKAGDFKTYKHNQAALKEAEGMV